MKFDTGMGILELPYDYCIFCIMRDRYMACTACEFKETLIAHAMPIGNRMKEELNKVNE